MEQKELAQMLTLYQDITHHFAGVYIILYLNDKHTQLTHAKI